MPREINLGPIKSGQRGVVKCQDLATDNGAQMAHSVSGVTIRAEKRQAAAHTTNVCVGYGAMVFVMVTLNPVVSPDDR